MDELEKNSELESVLDSTGAFEILEEYAEEDASFMSSLSTVKSKVKERKNNDSSLKHANQKYFLLLETKKKLNLNDGGATNMSRKTLNNLGNCGSTRVEIKNDKDRGDATGDQYENYDCDEDINFDEQDTWEDRESILSISSSTPVHSGKKTTNSLLHQYFPTLRPTKSPTPKVLLENSTINSDKISDINEDYKKKLIELEKEKITYQKQNNYLAHLNTMKEKEMSEFRSKVAEFEQRRAQEVSELKAKEAEANKELDAKRRLLNTRLSNHNSTVSSTSISKLKEQVSMLQKELKSKSKLQKCSEHRYKSRISQLEKERDDVKEELKVVERNRQGLKAKLCLNVCLTCKSSLSVTNKDTEDDSKLSVPPLQKFALKFNNMSPRSVTSSINSIDTCSAESADEYNQSVTEMQLPSENEQPLPLLRIVRHAGAGANSIGSHKVSPVLSFDVDDISNCLRDILCSGHPEIAHHNDGKVEKIYPDGVQEIIFTNGTVKRVTADRSRVLVKFFNGDIKAVMKEGRVVYLFAEAQTTHVTYPDDSELILFPNSQVEKIFPDGSSHILFPDSSVQFSYPNGSTESISVDGTKIHVSADGTRTVSRPNGQHEMWTSDSTQRIYPDGTVKIVYKSGKKETRYANGRVRIKDENGSLIMDRMTEHVRHSE